MPKRLKPGDHIYFLEAMTVRWDANRSAVFPRASVLEVTEEVLEASKDRNGSSWLDLTPEEQIAKFGRQRFGYGDCPPDVTWWNTPGDRTSWKIAKDRARLVASKLTDPEAVAKEWARIEREIKPA